MKELHNHIFSNTTCISKETMLRYINKQLTKEELHKVETHMLDCELCTDAYAGLALTQNSSMIFAIDNEIDKRVKSGVVKAPLMRNIMFAASVLAIVFGTYFTFSTFNKTIDKDGEIALNKEVKDKEQEQLESVMSHSTGEVDLNKVEEKNELKADENKDNFSVPVPEPTKVEEVVLEDEIVEEVEALSVESVVEMDELAEAEENIVVEYQFDDKEELKSTNNYLSNTGAALDNNKDATNSERRTVTKKRSKNKLAKSSAIIQSEPAISESSLSTNLSEQNVLVIEGYKVVDYLDEYQKAYDDENALKSGFNSVSADYETEEDKVIAEKAKEEVVVEITYKQMLEHAIRSYKKEQYKKALAEFDVILVKHSKEVNAQFYSGMCYYHLGQNAFAIKKFDKVLKNERTEFNEETNWYKALTLIKMNDNTSAKKILNKIVQQNGFYKDKAEEKLKSL